MSASAKAPPVRHWHLASVEDTLRALGGDGARGLTSAEAAERLATCGRNELQEGRRRGIVRMLADQFADFMIVVLIGAAVVSGLIGDLTDTIAIVVIVALNAVIGFVQEYRAERAVAALKLMAAPSARVVRDSELCTIPAAELVPGDLVEIEAGNVVPADLRLIDAHTLRTEEAALTGESQPVEKFTRALHEPALPLGDRRNLAFKGTLVSYGRGRGVVVGTGMQTELGRIAQLLHEEEEVRTPLQKRLARFGARLAIAVLAICVVVFVAGVLRGEPVVLMLLTAISLAVAAIPEALPAVVTVTLALGAVNMARRQALIRRLPAVETLGSVTFICSDKTGTLTENRMRVEEYFCGGAVTSQPGSESPWPDLLTALALSNDARYGADERAVGDPTEVALLLAAEAAGYGKAERLAQAPRLAELPFDSDRKRMTTLHRGVAGVVAYVKGAPEVLLPLCSGQLSANGRAPIDAAAVNAAAERMAADGLRVIAFASRPLAELPATPTPDTVETDLTFLGLAGLLDPPRAEAAEAVALCRSAGITPVMITGDHPATARSIARRLGILDDVGDAVMTWQDLDRLSDRDLDAQVAQVRVYARVAPEHKIRIVKALQARGELVAMTGDGVNDAPALRRADIGVAMGVAGTDVAKEAAHMILLDDNFATIVSAVREGRRIFDNIRKFIKYTMTSNSGEIWTIFLAPFIGLPIPLLPIHILWINLVTDGLPGLALAAEPEERGLMRRPPRPPDESVFAHGMWQHIVWVGLLMGAVCLFTQAWAVRSASAHWQTMVFTVLTLSQMGHALAIRSERDSLFRQGLGSNRPLLGAVVLTLLLQLATIYVPALNPIFRTEPLTAGELAACLGLSSLVFVAVEIEKWFIRHGRLYGTASPVDPARS
ncbi:cation-translocating P-type ATPase [Candidatus Binatia bacterium]|nr:cation-translocating P-type ATPase [Candidatus Binatia bacterium]